MEKKTVINRNIGFKCSEEEIEYFDDMSKELVLNKSVLFRRMVKVVREAGGIVQLEQALGMED